MKRFQNEYFSFECLREKNDKLDSICFSYHTNGRIILRRCFPNSMDTNNTVNICFQLSDKNDLAYLEQVILIFKKRWLHYPFDIRHEFNGGEVLHTVFFGKETIATETEKEDIQDPAYLELSKDEKKRVLWSFVVTEFSKEMISFSQRFSFDAKTAKIHYPEQTFLKPHVRCFLTSLMERDVPLFEKANTKEECQRAALRHAYKGREMPDGKTINTLLSSVKKYSLKILNEANSHSAFDRSFIACIEDLSKESGLPFAECAYLYDWTYLYYLLTKEIIYDEVKADYLHYPSLDEAMIDSESYLNFQHKMRRKGKIIHQSPIFYFLFQNKEDEKETEEEYFVRA